MRPRNKNGHWPFVDLFDKNSQVMGLYEGSLVLRGGALVPEGYHMMPLKRICHVVTQELYLLQDVWGLTAGLTDCS